ncbi:MAG: hypothetical protein QOF14_1613 [Hyphomicrobiales bacterium]|nr:hypothetical protein [Hyphomicrobiales bacterium]
MAKTAKKKAKKGTKPSGKSNTFFSLTSSGLKKAGAKPFPLPQAASVTAAGHPSTHTEGSVIVAPGPNGTTIVCKFNPNTGNFDDCHTVTGNIGLQA